VLASCGRVGFQAAPDDDGGDGPLDQIDDSSDQTDEAGDDTPIVLDAPLMIDGPSPAGEQVIVLTTSGTFTVPSNWNNLANRIECIGGGGTGSSAGGGGAGGAYALRLNVTFETPTVAFEVGGAVSLGADGGDSWFCQNMSCTRFSDPGILVAARGGGGGQGTAGGTPLAGSVGTIMYDGGRGGPDIGGDCGGGGGGAGGPNGPGGAGGDSERGLDDSGGGGGGNGGGGRGGNADNDTGGRGGDAADGQGGAAASTGAGDPGMFGGGGGGAGGDNDAGFEGGAGGDGRDLTATVGGGGGGGGGGHLGGDGGSGGFYGGGGGGASESGEPGLGGPGVCVVRYVPIDPSRTAR